MKTRHTGERRMRMREKIELGIKPPRERVKSRTNGGRKERGKENKNIT